MGVAALDDTAPPPLSLWLSELPYTLPIILSPVRRVRPVPGAAPGAGQPVLVFPGILSSDNSTALLRRTLDRAGYCTHASQLGFVTGITPATFARAEARLAEVAKTEGRKVALLGWSLGGIYARVITRSMHRRCRMIRRSSRLCRRLPCGRAKMVSLPRHRHEVCRTNGMPQWKCRSAISRWDRAGRRLIWSSPSLVSD
jgi:hypothetical protein